VKVSVVLDTPFDINLPSPYVIAAVEIKDVNSPKATPVEAKDGSAYKNIVVIGGILAAVAIVAVVARRRK